MSQLAEEFLIFRMILQYQTGLKSNVTHPGVANDALSDATAISQLATNWQPAAVANPGQINYKIQLTTVKLLQDWTCLLSGAITRVQTDTNNNSTY